MSLIVSVHVPTGVVVSGDSRTTGTVTQVVPQPTPQNPQATGTVQTNVILSDAAEKVFIVFKRFGVGTFGTALINNMPIAHYIEQYEAQNAGNASATTQDCANDILAYFRNLSPVPDMGLIIVGYDNNDPYVLAVNVTNNTVKRMNVNPQNPQQIQYGILRGGDTAVVDRLLSQSQFNPIFDAMNLQDAIDYSRHLIRSTIDQMRFEPRFSSVGGPIDTLTITPTETRFLKKKELKC